MGIRIYPLRKSSKLNYVNFAGATNIDIVKIKEIPQLLYRIAYTDGEVNCLTNWDKENILLNKIAPQIADLICNQHRPYNKANLVTNEKFLGVLRRRNQI